MTIPDYQTLMLPVLRLYGDNRSHRLFETADTLAQLLSLTPEERQQLTKNGRQTLFYNRVYWATIYLRRAGLLNHIDTGTHIITERGQTVLAENPTRVDMKYLARFVDEKTLRGDSSTISSRTKPTGKSKIDKPEMGKATARPKRRREDSRPALFTKILQEAGKPLHYAEIYQQALLRLPKTKHFAKNLTYVTLYSSARFCTLGDGIFGLVEWENQGQTILRDGETVFLTCPEPLLPLRASPGAYLESLLIGRDLLVSHSELSATVFFREMRKWAERPLDLPLHGAQQAFDAWYAAGLLGPIRLEQDAERALTLMMPDSIPFAEVRKYCLDSLCRRINRMPELLMALAQMGRATAADLQHALFGGNGAGRDLPLRLTLLAALAAVRQEGDTWQLSAIGHEISAKHEPAEFSLVTVRSDDSHTTKMGAHGAHAEHENYLFEIDEDEHQSVRYVAEPSFSGVQKLQLWTAQDEGVLPEAGAEDAKEAETQITESLSSRLVPENIHDSDVVLSRTDDATEEMDVVQLSVSRSPVMPTHQNRHLSQHDLEQHMKNALAEAVRVLFPLMPETVNLIRPHAWRNVDYVGEIEGKPCTWRGWSVNLSEIEKEYGAVYLDYVSNRLPLAERSDLFGDRFAEAISSMSSYVIAYVAGLLPSHAPLVEDRGFVVRRMGRTIHACLISSDENFVEQSELYWAASIARLINLRRFIALLDRRQGESWEREEETQKNGARAKKQRSWLDWLGWSKR